MTTTTNQPTLAQLQTDVEVLIKSNESPMISIVLQDFWDTLAQQPDEQLQINVCKTWQRVYRGKAAK